jgi:Ser/Thr protein kinase RdoA (MazF antagonist)
MDDAAGGRRGLRAIPSPALFAAVRERYGIDSAEGVVDLGGSSSLNLRIADSDDTYVLRVYRPYVTEARLDDIGRVRHELTKRGVHCSEIVLTRDSCAWICLDDRLVEVERYVEHDANMDSWERLEAGLPVLGRIHSILRDIEVGAGGRRPLFANCIESDDVVAATLRGAQRIRGWGPTLREQRLAANAEELARLVFAAERDFAPHLPRQLVHGDFWDNNVFFRAGGVVHVADFDFMGERARIDDLALTLYFASLKYLAFPVSDHQLYKLRTLVDAYERGLNEPLTMALPLAMARQPLWSIGGWVATLDCEESARKHAAATYSEIEWALSLMHELDRWQTAFASPVES